MKSLLGCTKKEGTGRTPHGVRGLKWFPASLPCSFMPSHPSRGAWIEMTPNNHKACTTESHPSRGAWIEMMLWQTPRQPVRVAPLTGCVD